MANWGSISGIVIPAGVYSEAGRSAAPACDRRTGRQVEVSEGAGSPTRELIQPLHQERQCWIDPAKERRQRA